MSFVCLPPNAAQPDVAACEPYQRPGHLMQAAARAAARFSAGVEIAMAMRLAADVDAPRFLRYAPLRRAPRRFDIVLPLSDAADGDADARYR